VCTWQSVGLLVGRSLGIPKFVRLITKERLGLWCSNLTWFWVTRSKFSVTATVYSKSWYDVTIN